MECSAGRNLTALLNVPFLDNRIIPVIPQRNTPEGNVDVVSDLKKAKRFAASVSNCRLLFYHFAKRQFASLQEIRKLNVLFAGKL